MNRRVGRGPRPSDAWTRRSGCTPRHLRAWWRHPALLYFTLLYSTLLYSTLLYSTLLYFTLLYPTLLYSTLLYFTLLYSALLYSTLLYFSRESTFYLYFVKVESGLSRNDRCSVEVQLKRWAQLKTRKRTTLTQHGASFPGNSLRIPRNH